VIAKVTRGASFSGLMAYLTRGDRATWINTRNLVAIDPELAPTVMRATAAASDRIERPVYHLVLSAAPEDRLTNNDWHRLAGRLLEDIGLGDHQAVYVRHQDGGADHVHIMACRVAPDGTVWTGYRDHYWIQSSLRRLERDFHLRPLTGRPEKDSRGHRTPAERQQARHGARSPWADDVVAKLRPHFRKATSWADLAGRVEHAGYRLERRGRGLVVTDGGHSIKASRIDRQGSRGKLEARFEETYRAWEDRRRGLDRELTAYDSELARRQRLTQLQDRVPPAESERHHRLDQAQHQVDRRLALSEDRFDRYRRELGERAFRLLVPPRLAKPISYALRFQDLVAGVSRYEDLTRRLQVVGERWREASAQEKQFESEEGKRYRLEGDQVGNVRFLAHQLHSKSGDLRQLRKECLGLAQQSDKERRRALRQAFPWNKWPTKDDYARFTRSLDELAKTDQALAQYGPAWEARRQEHRDHLTRVGWIQWDLKRQQKPVEQRIQRAVGSYGLQLARRFLSKEAVGALDQSLADRRRRLEGAIRSTTRELAQLNRLKRALGYSSPGPRVEVLRRRRQRLQEHRAHLERRHLTPAGYRLAVTAAKTLVPPKVRLAIHLVEQAHRIHRSLSRDRDGGRGR
jgi:hypothetical protein